MSFVKKYKKIIFIIIPVIAAFLIIITLTNKNLIARLKGEAYAESGFTDQNFYNCVVEAYNSVNYGVFPSTIQLKTSILVDNGGIYQVYSEKPYDFSAVVY